MKKRFTWLLAALLCLTFCTQAAAQSAPSIEAAPVAAMADEAPAAGQPGKGIGRAARNGGNADGGNRARLPKNNARMTTGNFGGNRTPGAQHFCPQCKMFRPGSCVPACSGFRK